MEPKYYRVKRIDGDYARLVPLDEPNGEENSVARALLPMEMEEGSVLKWENFVYTLEK